MVKRHPGYELLPEGKERLNNLLEGAKAKSHEAVLQRKPIHAYRSSIIRTPLEKDHYGTYLKIESTRRGVCDCCGGKDEQATFHPEDFKSCPECCLQLQKNIISLRNSFRPKARQLTNQLKGLVEETRSLIDPIIECSSQTQELGELVRMQKERQKSISDSVQYVRSINMPCMSCSMNKYAENLKKCRHYVSHTVNQLKCNRNINHQISELSKLEKAVEKLENNSEETALVYEYV